MTDFGTIALASQVTQAGTGIAGAHTEAGAIRLQSAYDQAAAAENARILERQARYAEEQGSHDVSLIGRRARQIQGSQRARLAAQGVDVSSGSALDVQMETEAMSEMDKLMARNNAAREAYGYRSQAQAVRHGASMQGLGARSAARSTLLQSYTSGAKDVTLGAYYYDQMGQLKKKSDLETLKAHDPYQKKP